MCPFFKDLAIPLAGNRWQAEHKDMQVFVCYPSEHESEARELRGFIRSVGLDCWFDKDSLIGGDDWDRERREALKAADVVAVLCSAETTGRNGVYQREINEALEHSKDRRLGTRYIIPIRIADVDLPPELQRLQYVDLFANRWRQALALALRKAVEEKGEPVPLTLEVASAEPDEGGTRLQRASEERPNGTIEADWFVYEAQGQYWDFVNGVIQARVLGGMYEARRHIDERTPREEWPGGSYWEINLTEFYRKAELVSITVGWSDYFAGAAHPNHGVETINIFGDQAGIIPISDIFDDKTDPLAFLTRYANQDIQRQAESENEAWSLDQYVEDYGWQVFQHFSFNEEGMQLNLSASSGLPHVLGFQEVYVPWIHAEKFLAPVARRILLKQDQR